MFVESNMIAAYFKNCQGTNCFPPGRINDELEISGCKH